MTEIKPLPPMHAGEEMPRHYLIALLQSAQSLWQSPNRNTALRFSRHLALAWLAYFPGDLQVNLLYSQALLLSGSTRQAVPILKDLCQVDPEYIEAQQLLRAALQASGDKSLDDNSGYMEVLSTNPVNLSNLPGWVMSLRDSRLALIQGELDQAEQSLHQALLTNPSNPLVAVTHLRVSALHQIPPLAMQELASHYQSIWPNCLAPILYLADALMDGGASEQAVALLHQAATRDILGQVAERLWGHDHVYRDLWPAQIKAPIDIPIPAEITSVLGWNRLPPPEKPAASPDDNFHFGSLQAVRPERTKFETADTLPLEAIDAKEGRTGRSNPKREHLTNRHLKDKPGKATWHNWDTFDFDGDSEDEAGKSPVKNISSSESPIQLESLYSIQAELEEVAARLKKRHLARVDGRFPVYVVLTTRKGLEQNFGSKTTTLITEMKRLVAAVAARNDWDAVLVIADDVESMNAFGLKPVIPTDPWKLKLVLADLDSYLSTRGEMIGALLIVGGPEVVPFHHLPNPVDDNDIDVPSDNPYATRDENYFIPEWPVGRLPTAHDANLLLKILADITSHHLQAHQRHPWYDYLWRWFVGRLPFRNRRASYSWGYTAAIWRRASISVFRPIGESHAMSVSPPFQVDNQGGKMRNRWIPPTARLGYFNLHGVKDSAEWYGQRDPAEPSDDPDYPIALRPQDVKNSGHAPQIVFSEACYGAHIIGKGVEEAMALKFLASGSLSVIGSTTTSYGSVTPPLIAADLLSNAFWKFIRGGMPAGEALRRAKIHLAREMNRRQDYLDGEDQKTLISFVFYGDPLALPADARQRSKAILRSTKTPSFLKTTCDKILSTGNEVTPKAMQTIDNSRIPPEVMAQVKSIVDKYLPGMVGADMSMSYERFECSGEGHTCPSSQLGSKGSIHGSSERRIITLSKHVKVEEGQSEGQSPDANTHIHWHLARLTLDNQGKVIKMAVSR